ncbi:hypothetical protein ANN_18841 [Periplaneta americana]|uniref:Uncharacterized protein n=1 Tax=Periplaneta americana TaxID=6978 RepID=A0ABQ8SPW5_PERAM|nr:hypothetical protein ANN_18841 [Periplaneta americana]
MTCQAVATMVQINGRKLQIPPPAQRICIFCYTWTDDESGKGPNQIASNIYDCLKEKIDSTVVKKLRLFSDGCGAQNPSLRVSASYSSGVRRVKFGERRASLQHQYRNGGQYNKEGKTWAFMQPQKMPIEISVALVKIHGIQNSLVKHFGKNWEKDIRPALHAELCAERMTVVKCRIGGKSYAELQRSFRESITKSASRLAVQ